MLPEVAEFVIQGMSIEGEVFQPPDWAERLCDSLARAGADGRKMHSSYVCPLVSEGVKCVAVRTSLQEVSPQAFDLILHYIAENRLRVRLGRGGGEDGTGSKPGVIARERRDPNRNIW